MKSISSIEVFKKKLKKCSVLTVTGRKYYLNDFHKTPVLNRCVDSLFEKGLLEVSDAGHWFEKGYKLRRPVDTKRGVEIYRNEEGFFFFIGRKKIITETYEKCLVELGCWLSKSKY